MFWMPGRTSVGPFRALGSNEMELEHQLRADVEMLANTIGERNVSAKPDQLDAAAQFIDHSMNAAGYRPQSLSYNVGGVVCRNIVAEIRGAEHPEEIVILGAHYDSVSGSPGADDNASGVAAMLALARGFAHSRPGRTLRFVAFANEEPPYFWQPEMGSLVYARRCREAAIGLRRCLVLSRWGSIQTIRRVNAIQWDLDYFIRR